MFIVLIVIIIILNKLVKIITEGEPVVKHHPMSCYVSRKLNEINEMISKDLGNDPSEILLIFNFIIIINYLNYYFYLFKIGIDSDEIGKLVVILI